MDSKDMKAGMPVRVVGNSCAHRYGIGGMLTLKKLLESSYSPADAWRVVEGSDYIRPADVEPVKVVKKEKPKKFWRVASDGALFASGTYDTFKGAMEAAREFARKTGQPYFVFEAISLHEPQPVVIKTTVLK